MTLSLDVDEKRVLRLRAAGVSWRKLAKRCGIAPTTARKIVQRAHAPVERNGMKRKPASPKTLAGVEAAMFIRLVKMGRMTPEEAENDISVSAEDSAWLEQLSIEGGACTRKMVSQALRLRDQTLAEFRCDLAPLSKSRAFENESATLAGDKHLLTTVAAFDDPAPQ